MLNERDTFMELTARDIMTQNPKLISPTALVMDAFHIMEDFKITQLVVVDHGQYKGVLHLHDILKEGVL
jgi:arabinose-5-phosphate isomerase